MKLVSYPVIVSVDAGVTRTISTPDEFNGFAISVQLINQDAVNVALVRINGLTTQQFNVLANGSIAFTDMWINQIQIIAGGAGSLIVMMQMVETKEV